MTRLPLERARRVGIRRLAHAELAAVVLRALRVAAGLVELGVQELVEQHVAHEPARHRRLVEHRMDADERGLRIEGPELQRAHGAAWAAPAPGDAARMARGVEAAELARHELAHDLAE